MNVSAGNLQDPIEWRGMAHLLEHMILQGCAKYPGASDFKAFIASAAGKSNAHTGLDNTNYHFSCAANRLEEGMDRFASLFVEPLLNEQDVLKEINAVDSEHTKNIHEDSRREFQLLRSTTAAGQPFCQFGSGNKYTLMKPGHSDELARITRPRHFESHADLPAERAAPMAAHPPPDAGGERESQRDFENIQAGIAEQLRIFWKTYYSANVMKLAVQAPCPLDQLQQWVTHFFSGIPCSNIEPMQGVRARWAALSSTHSAVLGVDATGSALSTDATGATGATGSDAAGATGSALSAVFPHAWYGFYIARAQKN
jgi:insulysin